VRLIRRPFLVLVLTAAAGVGLIAEETLRITPFVRDDHVVVTFELDDAYSDAVRDAIRSGLRTTFTYQLDLRTTAPGWFDRTIASTVVSTTDQYDNLTRRHTLTRTADGRVIDSLVTQDESVVKTWLTKWTRVPVSDTSKLDPTREYYVRITTRARPLGGSLLGFTKTIVGRAKFTYIP
jgi:Domain of unknown function (DUF4390)